MTDVNVEQQAREIVENLRHVAERDQSPGDFLRTLLRDAVFEIERLTALSSAPVVDISYAERVRYELRVLEAEMRGERLKRLVTLPSVRGGYIGDTYYPVGGIEASHRWDGHEWQWLPELCADGDVR